MGTVTGLAMAVRRRRIDDAARRVVEDAAREAAGEVDVDVELLAGPRLRHRVVVVVAGDDHVAAARSLPTDAEKRDRLGLVTAFAAGRYVQSQLRRRERRRSVVFAAGEGVAARRVAGRRAGAGMAGDAHRPAARAADGLSRAGLRCFGQRSPSAVNASTTSVGSGGAVSVAAHLLGTRADRDGRLVGDLDLAARVEAIAWAEVEIAGDFDVVPALILQDVEHRARSLEAHAPDAGQVAAVVLEDAEPAALQAAADGDRIAGRRRRPPAVGATGGCWTAIAMAIAIDRGQSNRA